MSRTRTNQVLQLPGRDEAEHTASKPILRRLPFCVQSTSNVFRYSVLRSQLHILINLHCALRSLHGMWSFKSRSGSDESTGGVENQSAQYTPPHTTPLSTNWHSGREWALPQRESKTKTAPLYFPPETRATSNNLGRTTIIAVPQTHSSLLRCYKSY